MAGSHVTVLALNLGRVKTYNECMSMENSTPDRLTIFICKVVSLGALTVVPPSKGYDSHVESLFCLYYHHQKSQELLFCPVGHCHSCSEVKVCLHLLQAPPLERETLVAGSSERTTVHSVACCCIIVVTGN